MSIFRDEAPRYFESGYSVVPASGKRVFEKEWTKYCHTQASEEAFERWCEERADFNIGLCLGPASGVIAFDLDTDDPEIKSMAKTFLPPTPVVKVGKKGFSMFYQYNGEASREIKVGLHHVADLLSDGRQTIVPPSIHPETKKPFRWIHEDLSSMGAGELPALDPASLQRFEVALEAHLSRTSNKGSSATAAAGGRNNTIKPHIMRWLRAGLSEDDVVGKALEFSKTRFKPCLFEDRSEYPGETPQERCLYMVRSCKGTLDREASSKEYDGFFVVDEDGKQKPDFNAMAEHFRDDMHVRRYEHSTFIYDKTHYRYLGEAELEYLIVQKSHKKATPYQIGPFKKAILSQCFDTHEMPKPPEGLINLKNGVFNIKEKKLMPHSPEYFFKYVTSVAYNPAATAPRWLKFLDEVFLSDPGLARLAQQIFGYCLIGGKPFLHKAFWLSGEGRNGKSTFQEVLRKLLGAENVTSVPIDRLDKPFSAVMLEGKLANITDELTSKGVISSADFKIAVNGEGITAARKNQNEYVLYPTARFIFASNDTPKFGDSSLGLMRRIVAVPFRRTFTEAEQDHFLQAKLLEELSGVLNWALEGAHSLIQGDPLVEPEASKQAHSDFEQEANSVLHFCTEHVEYSEERVAFVSSKRLYAMYQIFCEEHGRPPVGFPKFAKNFAKWVRQYNESCVPWPGYDECISRYSRQKGYSCIVLKSYADMS